MSPRLVAGIVVVVLIIVACDLKLRIRKSGSPSTAKLLTFANCVADN